MANENVIPAGLPGYVMRKRIEDKATLHKGGMYVGTGKYETITDKKGNEYKVYKTEELPVGKEGQVLMSTVDGIKWEDPQKINFRITSASKSKVTATCDLYVDNSAPEPIISLQELLRSDYKNFDPHNVYFTIYDNQNQEIIDLGLVFIPRTYYVRPFVDRTELYYTIVSSVVNDMFLSINAERKSLPDTNPIEYYYQFSFSLGIFDDTGNVNFIKIRQFEMGSIGQFYILSGSSADEQLYSNIEKDLKQGADLLYYAPYSNAQQTITNQDFKDKYNSSFKYLTSQILESETFLTSSTKTYPFGILLKGTDAIDNEGIYDVTEAPDSRYNIYWKNIH